MKSILKLRTILAVAAACLAITSAAQVTPSESAVRTAEAGARKAMDAFMTTFNAKDPNAWAATLNYPHVRFASGTVRVWQNAAEFAADNKDYAKRLAPWDHSAWQSMQVIQSGPDKVHFSVVFVRYDANGKSIGNFPSLYIVTLQNGHWGVQGRSSYAP